MEGRSKKRDNVPIRLWQAFWWTGAAGQRTAGIMEKGTEGKRNWAVDNRSKGLFIRKMNENPWKDIFREELEIMNRGKVGAPYRVPDSVIHSAMLRFASSGKGYRDTAAEISSELEDLGLPGITFSQLKKRSDKLDIHMGTCDVTDARVLAFGSGCVTPDPERKLTVAADSTGLSTDVACGWRVFHWGMKKRRCWFKLHIVSDTETNEILAYLVSTEYYHDNLAFMKLMDIVQEDGHRVAAVYADAAYDSKDNYRVLRERGITFIANPRGGFDQDRRNCNHGKSKGCTERARHVRFIIENGRDEWKKSVNYSRRWKVEGTFSDMKRIFGETIRARGPDAVANAIYWIIRAFNLYKSCRKELGGLN